MLLYASQEMIWEFKFLRPHKSSFLLFLAINVVLGTIFNKNW